MGWANLLGKVVGSTGRMTGNVVKTTGRVVKDGTSAVAQHAAKVAAGSKTKVSLFSTEFKNGYKGACPETSLFKTSAGTQREVSTMGTTFERRAIPAATTGAGTTATTGVANAAEGATVATDTLASAGKAADDVANAAKPNPGAFEKISKGWQKATTQTVLKEDQHKTLGLDPKKSYTDEEYVTAIKKFEKEATESGDPAKLEAYNKIIADTKNLAGLRESTKTWQTAQVVGTVGLTGAGFAPMFMGGAAETAGAAADAATTATTSVAKQTATSSDNIFATSSTAYNPYATSVIPGNI